MKLISSKGKKRSINQPSSGNVQANRSVNSPESTAVSGRTASPRLSAKKKVQPRRMTKKKKVIIIISSILGLMLLFGISAFAVVRWQIQPFFDYFFRPDAGDLATLPAIVSTPRPSNTEGNENEDFDDYVPDEYEDEPVELAVRNERHVNFLLLGIDEHGNTDVVMLAALDLDDTTLNIVSIPRDTLVNVEWSIKKVNSIHAYMRNRHRNDNNRDTKAIEDTKEYFRDIIGFKPDHVVTVNMNAFVRLVDTVGPIPFNVPVSMNEMGISVPRGQRNLTGREALVVMRSRRSYQNHAIGRDYAQQEFLMAVAKTVLATNWSAGKIADMVDIFNKNVTTDIALNHLVGFATDFMRLKLDNIKFHMMPGAIDSVGRQSYVTIQVKEWLEVINENFNPFNRDITDRDVSIFTRGPDRRLMVTDDNWQANRSWGSSSLGSSNPYLTTATDRPVPGRAPAQHQPEADTDGDRNPATGVAGDDGGGGPGDDGGGTTPGDGGDGGDD
ncbi:MAG: LCP family protein [Oscillospiraceae bacterium]|nr:LCP family protein [Oscillospiraceae bacterium]